MGGHDLVSMSARERTLYRRLTVGFVWQQTAKNLLPYLTAAENVELPMSFDRVIARDRRDRAAELLSLVGVVHRSDHRPDQLSGGEQARVAIAVALANEPEVLFADEPTGELDSATSTEVFAALQTVNRQLGTTIVVLTHDALVSEQVDRTVTIRDGRTSLETLREAAVAREYAVLDRAGRLQLPSEYVAALDLRRRVRLELERDHVGVWPDSTAGRDG